MRLYESVFIARQDVSTQLVETLTKDFSAIIENGGGKIHKHEYWGLRALAYRVKKNRKGHYVMLNIEADNDTLREYERIMGLNEDILRFMNISIEEVEEGPSVMMQAQKAERSPRGERSDRGDRGDRGDRDTKPAPAGDADSEAPAETAAKADGE
jgi:small subunit ribosomal protein S6